MSLLEFVHNQGEVVKAGMDVVSASVALAALASWLPPAAALLTVIWTGIRIYDRFWGPDKGSSSD